MSNSVDDHKELVPITQKAKGYLNPFSPADYFIWEIQTGDSLEIVLEKGRSHLEQKMGWSKKEAAYLYPHATMYVNGECIPASQRKGHIVKQNDYVDVRVAPHGGGGGGSGRIIASIVVAILAVVVAIYAPYALPAIGSLGGAMLGMAVSLIGGLLINAIFPVRPPKLNNMADAKQGTPAYLLTGTQNEIPAIGDPVPQVLGRIRTYPKYASNPQTIIRGNHQFFRGVYIWSAGEGKVESIKLGDTDISKFSGISINTYTWQPGDALRLISRPVREISVNVEMKHSDGWVSRSTTECDFIGLDWVYAQGIYGINDEGDMYGLGVTMEARYRKIGTNDPWKDLFTAPFIVNFVFDIPPAYGDQVITYGPCGPDFPYQHRDQCYSITRTFAGVSHLVYVDNGLTGIAAIRGNNLPPGSIPLFTVYTVGSSATVTKLSTYANSLTLSWEPVGTTDHLRVTVTGQIPVSAASGYTSGKTRDAIMRSVGRGVEKGSYDVEFRRATGDRTNLREVDTVTWASFKYGTSGAVLKYKVPVTITEIEIQADNQLQGALDNLNGIYSAKMPVWDADLNEWRRDYTSNCASAALEVLTGAANLRRRSWDEIDSHSFVDFWQTCEAERWTYNKVHNQVDTVWNVVSDICAGGWAYPFSNMGIWGVTQDNIKNEIRQLISPHNSWGFVCTKALPVIPHGLRVVFWNEDTSRIEEFRVYNDGYDEHTATEFEKVDFPGKTNYRENFIFARTAFAAAQLRPETVQVSMDLEYLVLARRDRVALTYDVMKVGICSGRIKKIHHPVMVDGSGEPVKNEDGSIRYNTSLISGVTVDNLCEMDTNTRTYGIFIRLHDGRTTITRPVVFIPGGTYSLQFVDAVSFASGIREGMLFGFGELGKITSAWTVKNIETSADMTAVVSLIPYVPAIWDAAYKPIPPYNPDMTDIRPADLQVPAPPINLNVTETLLRRNGRATNQVSVSWSPPLVSDIMPVSYNISYRRVGDVAWTSGSSPITNFNFFGLVDGDYEFQVVSVSMFGTMSSPATIDATLVYLYQICQDITGLTLDSFSDQPMLRWDMNTDHTEYYEVRYTPIRDVTTDHWESAAVLYTNITWNTPYVAVSLQRGTYMVRPFSATGTTSINVAMVMSGISSSMITENVIETINSDRDGGIKVDTTFLIYPATDIRGLILDYTIDYDTKEVVFAPVGYFYFDKTIELGGLFTVKVDWTMDYTSYSINNDIFIYPDIFVFPDIFNIENKVYSVAVEYSYCEEETMQEWSDWKPVMLPTITCYGLRFRLVLISPNCDVSPFIRRVVITVDVPDRLYRKENFFVSANPLGTVIYYEPPFMAKPYTGITIENGQVGDDWNITEQTESSFRLFLFNVREEVEEGEEAIVTPVSRVIDFFSSGYGYNLRADTPALPAPPIVIPLPPPPPPETSLDTIYTIIKQTEEQWPGELVNGEVNEDNAVTGIPVSPAWGGVYDELTYTVKVTVPLVPEDTKLDVLVFLQKGAVRSIETIVHEYPYMWTNAPMWGNRQMWPVEAVEHFGLFTEPISVTSGMDVYLRVTAVSDALTIEDIHIVFGK